MDSVVRAEGLSKRYPGADRFALEGVTFEAATGEIVGLVGPNGSGKTTLLKILATVVRPTSGAARVAGCAVGEDDDAVRARTGFASGNDRSFYWRLTGRRNLEVFAGLHGLPRAEARRRAADLLERLGVAEADRPFGTLSAGHRQRLALARALLHDPPVLLLDEPTRSLDPWTAERLRGLLRGLAAEGRTILLASHVLAEVEDLCDRAAVLAAGRIAALGRPAEVLRRPRP